AIVAHNIPFGSPGIVDGKQTITSNLYYPISIQRTVFDLIYGRGYQKNDENRLNLKLKLDQKLDIITKGLSFSLVSNYRSGFNEISKMNAQSSHPIFTPIFLTDAPSNAISGDSTIVFQKDGTYNPVRYGGNYQVRRYLY